MSSLDSLAIPQEKRRYISEQLNPLLTELVTDCLRNCPENPAVYEESRFSIPLLPHLPVNIPHDFYPNRLQKSS